MGKVVQRTVHKLASSGHESDSARECQYARHRREDRDSVPLEEARRSQSRTVLLQTRGALPVQLRRHKVGVGFSGVRRGEKLSIWRVRAIHGVVGKVAIV